MTVAHLNFAGNLPFSTDWLKRKDNGRVRCSLLAFKRETASNDFSRHPKTSKASSVSLLKRQEAAAKLAMLKAEMEHHANVAETQALAAKNTAEAHALVAKNRAEAQALVAKNRAEAQALVAKSTAEEQALVAKSTAELAKREKMRDIAAVSAEREALNEVEEDNRGMLPSDDESVGRQQHLQQYLEVQSKDVSPLPHKCVTFCPKHGSNGKSDSLMNEEGLGVSRGTNVNA